MRIPWTRVLLFAAFLLVPSIAMAEPKPAPAPEESGTTERTQRIRYFPPRLYAKGFFVLPEANYTTSRGFGLGGQVLFPFRWPGSDARIPACELKFHGRATFKSQALADFTAVLHPFSQPYELRLRATYRTLREKFYGIGPDTNIDDEEIYKPRSVRTYGEILRTFQGGLQIGFRTEYERVGLLETEEGGFLRPGTIRGSGKSAHAVGLGVNATFDRRDHRYSPTSGYYIKSFAILFDEEFGSDFDFNNYSVDARAYTSPHPGHVVAGQFFTYSARGAAPFWRMAELGGRSHSRGYRKGRFVDRVLVASQVEYRAHVWNRVGIAGFVGVADVAPTADHLEFENMKVSVGGGPRVVLGRADKGVVARFDVGFGGDVPRYYFSIGEAF